jgi:hypothetical protein
MDQSMHDLMFALVALVIGAIAWAIGYAMAWEARTRTFERQCLCCVFRGHIATEHRDQGAGS